MQRENLITMINSDPKEKRITIRELIYKINTNVTSTAQIPNKYGCSTSELLPSYRGRKQVTDNGVGYWLSSSRNQLTKRRILKLILESEESSSVPM